MCCLHAKQCTENKCPVPHCLKIRHNWRQQQIQKQLQQEQVFEELITSMADMDFEEEENPQQEQSQQETDFDEQQKLQHLWTSWRKLII